ncbi:hypothetical protein ACLOJK_029373 [Asimina triloba]
MQMRYAVQTYVAPSYLQKRCYRIFDRNHVGRMGSVRRVRSVPLPVPHHCHTTRRRESYGTCEFCARNALASFSLANKASYSAVLFSKGRK